MSTWQTRVLQLQPVSEKYTIVKLQRPENYQYTYGQYAQFTLSTGNSKFLAFASAPGDSDLLLLLASDTTGWGNKDNVLLDAARGGFSAALASRQPLLLVTHGSGISAFAGLIKDKDNNNLQNEIKCLWGVRSRQDLSILPFLGVSEKFLIPVFSRENGEFTGYVQHHLDSCYQRGMAVLLVGSKDMTSAVKNILANLGCPSKDIYFNF